MLKTSILPPELVLPDVAFPVILGGFGAVWVVVAGGMVEDVVKVETVDVVVGGVDVVVLWMVDDVVEVEVVDVEDVEVVDMHDSPAQSPPSGHPQMLHFSMSPRVVHFRGCVRLHSPTFVPSSQPEDTFLASVNSHMTSMGMRGLSE